MGSIYELFPETRQNIISDADYDGVDEITKSAANELLDYTHKTYGYNAPITSGYRDPERNAAAGGVPDSWHLQRKAVDLDLSGLSPDQIADVEAKARASFGEVLFHDVGSGMHLHAANPIQKDGRNFIDKALFSTAEAATPPAENSIYALFADKTEAPVPTNTAPAGNSLYELFNEKPATPAVDTSIADSFNAGIYGTTETKDGQFVNSVGKAIGSPLEALSALNKPLSAAAGTLLELQKQAKEKQDSFDVDTGKVWNAAKKAWETNDKSLLDVVVPKEEQDKYPIFYGILGFGLDAAGDPLQVVKPAKILGSVGKFLKEKGAADKIADIARIVSETKGGKVTGEIVDKIANYELGGIPLKRWFQEEGVLAKEVTAEERLQAALNKKVIDQQDDIATAAKLMKKEGVSPEVADEFVAKATQARPTVTTETTLPQAVPGDIITWKRRDGKEGTGSFDKVTKNLVFVTGPQGKTFLLKDEVVSVAKKQYSPEEIVKAYRDKTLEKAIIEGKVDQQDVIDALIAEKNAPEHRIFRAETKAKIDEIKAVSENTVNNLRRDMAAEGKSIAEINDAVKAVKESSRAEIASIRTLDRVQGIVEASRTGKGTYIADEFLTPQQLKEVQILRKEKAEALAELRESIDPYGLTIDELPDRIAFREARKPVDAYIKPKMDAALRDDPRYVPEWGKPRDVTSYKETPPKPPPPMKSAEMDEYFDLVAANDKIPIRKVLQKTMDDWSQVIKETVGEMRSSDRKGSSGTMYNDFTGRNERVIKSKNEHPGVQAFVTKNGRMPKNDEWYRVAEDWIGRDPESMRTREMAVDARDYLERLNRYEKELPTALPLMEEVTTRQVLFPQDVLDSIRYRPRDLSEQVAKGEILPQQVVDAVNKAKDSPTLTEVRLAQKKADIQQVIDAQDTAIGELDRLRQDKKITEEAYKTRLAATKEATKEAIADLALDVKIREIVKPPIVPRVKTKWLDDAKQEQISAARKEAALQKKEFAAEVDPYGISIDEKPPRQQIRDEAIRINKETRNTIDDIMTTKGVSREQVLSELDSMGLSPETATKVRLVVSDTAALMDEMSQLGYKAGMLTDSDMIRYFGGSHIRRSYAMFDSPDEWIAKLKEVGTPEEVKATIAAKQLADSRKDGSGRGGLNLDALIERVPLSEKTREAMGQIKQSEYLVGKTGQTNVPLFTQAKFFDDVKQRFAVAKDVGEGNDAYKIIPASAPDKAGRMKFGALAGQYVPKEIYGEVMLAAGKFAKDPTLLEKAVSWWKVGKLLNPATFARNIQSGAVMANVFGEVPSYALPKFMKKSYEEIKDRGAIYKEAREAGLFHGGINNAELKGIIGKSNVAEKYIDKAMSVYGKSDDYWRLVVYDFHRSAGKTVDEAVTLANNALFNYGKVPPLLDKMRKKGVLPFGAFPYFAAKETAKALYRDPASVTKYLRPQWQNEGTEEKAVMPEYLTGNTLMKLGKGEREVKGQKQDITSFLDMTYLLPFANDISIGPGAGLYDAVVNGKDFLGRDLTPPRASNSEVVLDRMAAAKEIAAPTLLTKSYWDKPYRAATNTPDDKGRIYSGKEAAAQSLLGWKTVNVNIPEEYRNRMIGLDIAIQKASADLNKLRRSANPDQKEIKQREDQIKSIVEEIRTIQRNKAKAK